MFVSAGQHNGSACEIWPDDWMDQNDRCRGLCYPWQTRAVLPSKEVRFRALELAKERDGPCSKEDEVGLESYDGLLLETGTENNIQHACLFWLALIEMNASNISIPLHWLEFKNSRLDNKRIRYFCGYMHVCTHEHTPLPHTHRGRHIVVIYGHHFPEEGDVTQFVHRWG